MRLHRYSAILLTAGAFSAGFMGCSSDPDDGAGGGETTTTTTTTTSGVSTGSVAPETDFLGAPCEEDADCGPEGLCDAESSPNGGPAGGYCTKLCEEDSDCEGEGSLCLEGICFLGCTPGQPALRSANDDLDPYKCHGREELRCHELSEGGAVCVPTCGSDSQCSDGRKCDPRTSLCVDEPTEGLPLGAECDPESEEDPCAGMCAEFADGVGVCTQFCSFGGDARESDCGGINSGLCIYGIPPIGVSDAGICTRACTAHSDCLVPMGRCEFFGLNSHGFCTYGLDACESNDDCQEPDECAETPGGFFCLDPNYPLSNGSTGEGGGGAGGAGGGGAGGAGGGGDGGTGGAGGGAGGAGSGTGGAGGAGSGTGGAGGGAGGAGSGTGGAGGGAGGAGGGEGGAGGGIGGAGGAGNGAGGAGGAGGGEGGAGGGIGGAGGA